jgi:hypothetical protein
MEKIDHPLVDQKGKEIRRHDGSALAHQKKREAKCSTGFDTRALALIPLNGRSLCFTLLLYGHTQPCTGFVFITLERSRSIYLPCGPQAHFNATPDVTQQSTHTTAELVVQSMAKGAAKEHQHTATSVHVKHRLTSVGVLGWPAIEAALFFCLVDLCCRGQRRVACPSSPSE